MKQHSILAGLLAFALAGSANVPAQENGSVIIFYQDPFAGVVDFGACQGDAIFAPAVAAVFGAELWFCLRGASAGGISGVEGYIEGLEATGWTFTFTPPEFTISDGSFTEPRDIDGDSIPETRRGNFAFGPAGPPPEDDSCRLGTFGNLLKLGDLQGSQDPIVTPMPNDNWIRFVAGDPPSNARFPCPLVTLCDAPAYTAVCVAGYSFLINPEQQFVEYCPFCPQTAVRAETWSGVKSLYRDTSR